MYICVSVYAHEIHMQTREKTSNEYLMTMIVSDKAFVICHQNDNRINKWEQIKVLLSINLNPKNKRNNILRISIFLRKGKKNPKKSFGCCIVY